jgi:hypothetical protein
MVVEGAIVRLVCAGKTGAVLDSRTITVKVFVALMGGAPLSVTIIAKTLVLGPWASVGAQVTIPLADIVAFAGADCSEYVRICVGESESVA